MFPLHKVRAPFEWLLRNSFKSKFSVFKDFDSSLSKLLTTSKLEESSFSLLLNQRF